MTSVTFGSVGDILAVCLLVKDLIRALDDCRGSADEYQEVIRELEMLDRVLTQVHSLSQTQGRSVELNAVFLVAQHAAEACRKRIEAFHNSIKKFDASLGSGASRASCRAAAMKIRWYLARSDGLDKFRAEINAHCLYLNMIMTTTGIKITETNSKRLLEELKTAEQRNQTTVEMQNSRFAEIYTRLQENTDLMQSIKSNTMAFVPGWPQTLGAELKSFMGSIIFVNSAILRNLLELRASLPGHLERALIEEPFMLEDAVGRLTPVHLQFINSWAAFDGVIEERFRNYPGHKKILSKEYVLQEHRTKKDISRNRPWEGTFLPGSRVDMSMLFEETQDISRYSCPGCQLVSDSPCEEDVQCSGCGIWYRRVVEISEAYMLPKQMSLLHRKPAKPPAKNVEEEEQPVSANDIRCFRRVRMVQCFRRVRMVQYLAQRLRRSMAKLQVGDTAWLKLGTFDVKIVKTKKDDATSKFLYTVIGKGGTVYRNNSGPWVPQEKLAPN